MKKLTAVLLALMLIVFAVPAYAEGNSTDGVVCYSPADKGDFFFVFPLQGWEFREKDNGYLLEDKTDALGIDTIIFSFDEVPEGLDMADSLRQIGPDAMVDAFTLMFNVNNDDPDTSFHSCKNIMVNAYEGYYLEGTSKLNDFLDVKFDMVLWATPRRFYNVFLMSKLWSYSSNQPALMTMLSTFQTASEADASKNVEEGALPVKETRSGRNNATSVPFISSTDNQSQLKSAQIQETVLVDDDLVQIIAKSITYKPYDSLFNGVDLHLSVHNKSNQKLILTCDMLLVNGFDVDSSMYIEVDPGNTAEDTLSMSTAELRWADIPVIADLCIRFSIVSSDYSLITTTPDVRLQTDAAKDYVQELNEYGMCIYEDEAITIFARQMESMYSSYLLVFMMENHTNDWIYLASNKVRINGIDIDINAVDLIAANANTICYLWISGDDLKAKNIDRIESVSIQWGINIYASGSSEITTEMIDLPIEY